MTSKRRKPDHYYYKAKKEGYRSRAAYKIQQMDQKFNIFTKGQVVLDLCGAPGSWSQVTRKAVGHTGHVILLDLQNVNLSDVDCYKCDITSDEIIPLLIDVLGISPTVDLLLADCSPKVTGAWDTDQARQIHLAETSIRLAIQLKASTVVTKVFQGRDFQNLRRFVSKYYKNIHIFKPKASRSRSAEMYLVIKDLLRGVQLVPATE